jgi:hypothetical protein
MVVTAEATGIYWCRVTEVVAHTLLEAINNHEDTTFKYTTKYQTSRKLYKKM